MGKHPGLIAALGLLAACGPGAPTEPSAGGQPSLAAVAITDVVTLPASFRITPQTRADIEACLGEEVTFPGEAVLVVHLTVLPDGTRKLVAHANPKGAVVTGVSSGRTYRLAASDVVLQLESPSGTIVEAFAGNIHVVGQGRSPGFFGHVLLHLTLTPEGSPTALVELLDIHCA